MIFSTILNWGHRRVIPTMGEDYLYQNLPKSTIEGEAHWYADSKWRDLNDLWFKNIPTQHIEIIEGQGMSRVIKRESQIHTYSVNANSTIKIRENTLYFPGWSVYSDNLKIKALPDVNGAIAFKLPEGEHFIKVLYEDISVLKNLKKISLFVFMALLLVSLASFLKGLKGFKLKI